MGDLLPSCMCSLVLGHRCSRSDPALRTMAKFVVVRYMAMSASRSFPKNWKSETHKGTTCNENVARQPKTSVT